MSQKLTSELSELQSTASSRSVVDNITWSAGAALIFGVVVCYFATKRSELTSELLCWVLLPGVFAIVKRRRNVDGSVETLLPLVSSFTDSSANETPSSISLWIIAACIAISSVFRAEKGIIVLFPALAPLLAVGHRYLRPSAHAPAGYHMSFSSLLRHPILGTILTAILAIVALSEWDPIAYALSAAPVVALFVAYTLLTPPTSQQSRWFGGRWLVSVDIEAAAWPLSLRVAILLAIVLSGESYLTGLPGIDALETLVLGSAKTLMWYFTSQLARNCSWLVAAVAGTFSLLATRNPFMQQTDTRALITVGASLLSLVQVLYLLPKQAKARLTLSTLVAIPLLPYFSNLAAIHFAQSSALTHAVKHPVEMLIREANANFDGLLRNQSSTYPAAYAEYQRRYGFDPPDGFEEWYKFTRSHRSPIIDEFDMISEGIAPFLRISGQEVLDIMSAAYNEPDHELWSCTTSGQPAKTECSHHGRENDRNNAQFFNRITEKIPAALNLKFLLNHLDEPTVMIPPTSAHSTKPVITNRGGQRAWDVLTEYCSSRRGRASPTRAPTVETYGLPFVTDRKAAMDLCQHAEYSEIHGLFAAPESLRLTQGLVPVLSNGAPSTMGDILYPSTAYVEEDRFAYHSENDVDWDEKQNNVYWAGSTTGGHARPGEWYSLHRQRFVELAQNLKRRTFSYLREKDGMISRVASSFFNGRLYDVAFANVLQCDARACKEQRQYFASKPWASGDRPFRSRLVFDLDGNGISGRYYKLLASKSLPLKQTIIHEWHDERLLPWVHYIPVSQSMEELPELVFYLTSTEAGRRRAREVAEQGRQWFTDAFREIDVVIYMYRLLLELMRLQDPDRPAWQIDVG
ncbi:hypothetical protein F5B22DRAFT_660426 [Xylaria bambusicola]|uniref:uncharacterized protein n=1 Tax=Xylaria bambusicola TaxID=326684 RepID=UPI002008BF6D|nr:uncharacterized protein F5B22DRAFT_660426 [Xylaria bambusicola]KAI0522051.1 hypothetical protein F5B22DRAFT_660426 [Xylaria bambusicola]